MRAYRWLYVGIVFIFSSAYCLASPITKAQDGVKELVTAPLQITENIKNETDNAKFLPFALVGGMLKGTFYMTKQIVTASVGIVIAPLEIFHKAQ